MASVESTIDVHVPVTTAYNQWTQFETFPSFMEGIEEVRQTDDTHLHWVAEIGGEREEWEAEITDQERDERVAWRSISGPANSGAVTFDPVDAETTRVTVRFEWEPEGFMEKAGAALGLDERRVEGDLERFRDLIERRGVETGAWRGEV
jgi:uncharacterized membrane protein